MFRYEKFWLPLLGEISESPESDLAWCPPLDIHWVWHTHMLAPVTYSLDCQAILGRLAGHRLTTAQERTAARSVGESGRITLIMIYCRQITKVVWIKHFPEEPFDLDESKGKSPREFPNGLVSKIGYNIEEAALRQRDFYYQVRSEYSS